LISFGEKQITGSMKLRCRRACLLIILVSAVAGRLQVHASEAVFRPIALIGWNADVVFESAASPAATSFDHPNQRPPDYPLYAWFESGLEGHTDGLPASRRFASAANTNVLFELQPYTTNNVLLLTEAKPAGKLVLVEPSAYRCLFILSAAGGGDSTVNLQFHFSDGTDSEPVACQVPDWWTASETKLTRTPAITGLGRSNGKQGFEYEEHGDDAFGLYQSRIYLTTLGLHGKTIQSISFKKISGGATAGIFAISGERSKSSDSPTR
jgi:hypothetical protein